MSLRYFALLDHVGRTADENLEPLVEEGLTVGVPVAKDGEVFIETMSVRILPAEHLPDGAGARIIPGTRTIECNDPRIADGLVGSGKYDEIPPPTKKQQADEAKQLKDAIAEAGTHSPEPDDPEHPDNNGGE
jgi:hypothetical protein